ncbi:hypothetical protein AB0M43_05170 [Longispora sp. NPDC051575]|uniref:hypothetical protein n=1 Tax=Longispora sp. NPDC051575 TaxID=3154943 RepID=UPI00342BBBFA
MASQRALVLAAPLCVAGYGVVRFLGAQDGRYGPGLDWQAAHLLGLAGMVLFVPVVLGLGQCLRRGPVRALTVTATVVGLLATMVQFGADIAWGALASDPADLRTLAAEFAAVPGVEPAFHTVGPRLFPLGLVVLLTLLAGARRMPWWSPVAVLAGILVPAVDPDLLPVAGLLMAVALAPTATWPEPRFARSALVWSP